MTRIVLSKDFWRPEESQFTSPFDISIGRCARVRDPFGNVIVMLDQSKGILTTDEHKRVTGVRWRK